MIKMNGNGVNMNECFMCSTVITKKDVVFETEDFIIVDAKTRICPLHYIIMTKKHITQENFLNVNMTQIDKILKILFSRNKIWCGYRMIINNGIDAGQVEEHFHIHVFGGMALRNFGI